jgi:asparagine synthase (glutamine-hydrolysing)
MCGIAGATGRGSSAAAVRQQLNTLLHRGPDAIGSFECASAVIGQTRLSIIDLVTGDPPITNADGTMAAVLNGEIYNYRKLRDGLSARGHSFSSVGDTEVLVHLAEESAPERWLPLLDGMFALAVTSRRTGRTVLARDRFGKKPLYLWRRAGRTVFASEIKGVLAHPWVSAEFDPSVIPDYLGFGYVPEPATAFRDVVTVPPGSYFIIEPNGSCDGPRSYWRLEAPHSRRRQSFRHSVALVRSSLQEATAKRLVADVEVGAFLSGGIDSTAVVAAIVDSGVSTLRTFTMGFDDDQGFDERPFARMVAERFGTDHSEFVVSPNAVELVDAIDQSCDQPFADSSAIPTFLLARETRRRVTVALSGDGGDEIFAGYERFIAAQAIARAEHLPAVSQLLNLAPHAARLPIPAKLRRMLLVGHGGMPDALRQWVAFIPDPIVDELRPGQRPGVEHFREIWRQTEGASVLDRILLTNVASYLLNDLLPKADRMTMASGLEVRSPFLDHKLAELALSLPDSHRLRGLTLKRVLRETLRGRVPDDVLDRPKRGFGVPLDRWFRTDLKDLACGLRSGSSALGRYVNLDVVKRLVEEHIDGRSDHGHALWALLMLQTFLDRRFL